MTTRDIYYSIEGKYHNGDNYYDKHYDIFELSELLETLLSGSYTDVKNSECPVPETLIIRPINLNGDEI